MENLKEHVSKIKLKYDELSEVEDTLKALKEEYEIKISPFKKDVEEIKKQITELETELDSNILAEYKSTGEKKYYGGYSIKNYTKISYDSNEALKWAKEKDMFLTLDTKNFEKACKSLNLSFVTTKDDPKVTHPKIIKLEE